MVSKNDTTETESTDNGDNNGVRVVSKNDTAIEALTEQLRSKDKQIDKLEGLLAREQELVKQAHLLLEAPIEEEQQPEPVQEKGTDTGTRVLIATMLVMITVFSVAVVLYIG